MQALRRVVSGAAAGARRFTVSGAARADDAAANAATKAFLDKFVARAPSTMAVPSFPTEYCARPGGRCARSRASPKPLAPRRAPPRARSAQGCRRRGRHARQGDAQLLPAALHRVPGPEGACTGFKRQPAACGR